MRLWKQIMNITWLCLIREKSWKPFDNPLRTWITQIESRVPRLSSKKEAGSWKGQQTSSVWYGKGGKRKERMLERRVRKLLGIHIHIHSRDTEVNWIRQIWNRWRRHSGGLAVNRIAVEVHPHCGMCALHVYIRHSYERDNSSVPGDVFARELFRSLPHVRRRPTCVSRIRYSPFQIESMRWRISKEFTRHMIF